ncbi:MAG: ketoacyl-ACP synthase III, partial [Anaerolineae bacterium]|nr:ketoacyl-ACP synthase III [Anaerolineae bacterium]
MTRYAQILATGSYVPERTISNAEIDELLGESTNQWLIDNVGIRQRHWLAPDQTTSDLVVAASREALNSARIGAEEVDLLIVSTDTPDYLSPSSSVVVQHKLGAVNAGCYDVNSACAGWVTALDQGARYVATDRE